MAVVVIRRPVGAGILTIVGGFFILLGGLFFAAIGVLFAHFFGGFASSWFFVGLVVGLLTMLFGGLMIAVPSGHTLFGIVAVVFAFLSIPFAVGGIVIGFILAILGGIMAFTFRPMAVGVTVGPPPPPAAPPWS